MWGSRATSPHFESAVRHGKVTVWAVWLSPAAPGITRQPGWVCTQPVPGLAVKACTAGRALPSPSRAEEQQSPPRGHCPLHLLQGPHGCCTSCTWAALAAREQQLSVPASSAPKGILSPQGILIHHWMCWGSSHPEHSRWAVQHHSPGEVPTCILYFCNSVDTGFTLSSTPIWTLDSLFWLCQGCVLCYPRVPAHVGFFVDAQPHLKVHDAAFHKQHNQ